MFKKFILIFFIFVCSFSFSKAWKVETENDEFENITIIRTGFYKDIDLINSLVFQIKGFDNKLNSKCWSEIDYVFGEFGMYDYSSESWDYNNIFLPEINTISLSVDGKVYNDLYGNSENFVNALKTIKTTSKVKMRVKTKDGDTNTLNLDKDEIKNIAEFFKKQCKLK